MAKKKPLPRLRGTPASGRTGSNPRRAANAPQGGGRQPTRQSSGKPRQPKATQKSKGGNPAKKRKPSVKQWHKMFQDAAKEIVATDGRRSKSVSRKSTVSGNKGKSSSRKTGDSGRHKKAKRAKVDKRTKAYKEKEKWRRYGHLIRLTRLRSRLWKLAPEGFKSYADTLAVAKCMLEKNEGRIPRSNEKLLELLFECLVEVGPAGEVEGEGAPSRQPPEIDIIGRWSFFELDELMISIPFDLPYDITSYLSQILRFKRAEYNYPDTFKPYVEYINRKVQQNQIDKYHEIAIEWQYNAELKAWEIFVYELLDSGFVADQAPLGIPRRPRPGAPGVTQTDEEMEELESSKEESKSAYDERQQLIEYVAKLVEQKNKLFEEYKYMMDHGDKMGAAITGDELGDVRRQIRALRTRITLLKKGKKKKKK